MKDTSNGTEQSSPVLSANKDAMPNLKQRFLEKFNIFPKGNPESTFTVFQYALSTYKTFDGMPVTEDLIFDKWAQYIGKCQSENRDQKWMKSMEKFISDKDFNINFSPSFQGKSFLDKY